MRSTAFTVAVVTALLAWTGTASAGNRYTYLVGGRAAAMGGAFTALADDGSAAWYNPAALTRQNRHSLDLSATAYGFEMMHADGIMKSTIDGETHVSDLEASQLAIVPTSFSTVFRLSDPDAERRHILAFSVFVPQQQKLSFRHAVKSADQTFDMSFALESDETRYVAGPSYGFQLTDHISLGAGLYAVYDDYKGSLRDYIALVWDDGTQPDSFFSVDFTGEGYSIALMAAAAVHIQWEGFHFGAMLRTPHFRLYESMRAQGVEMSSLHDEWGNQVESEFLASFSDGDEWGFSVGSPVEVRLGLGYEVPQSWRVDVDVVWHTARDAPSDETSVDHTVNVAVGAEIWLTESMPLALGFFTDFSPIAKLETFGDRRADYYGGTAALSFVTPYDVRGNEKTDRIVFATTVGVHYAYGSGDVVGLQFDFDADEAPDPEMLRPISGHDIYLFVGSTVRY